MLKSLLIENKELKKLVERLQLTIIASYEREDIIEVDNTEIDIEIEPLKIVCDLPLKIKIKVVDKQCDKMRKYKFVICSYNYNCLKCKNK